MCDFTSFGWSGQGCHDAEGWALVIQPTCNLANYIKIVRVRMHTGEKIGGKQKTIKVCMRRSQWEHHAPLDRSRHQRQEVFYIP